MKHNESLLEKIKRFNSTVTEKIDKDMTLFRKVKLFFDFLYEYKFNGTYLQDYIQYGFIYKTSVERKRYIVFGKLLEMMKICNNPKNRYIFDQKNIFDQYFSKYLCRTYLDTKKATFEEFANFIHNKDNFFAKQPNGMFGTGVEKVFIKNISDCKKLYDEYKKQGILCEETLTQCKEMREFNDTSINTLRIVTLRDIHGDVHIMGGLLRVGRKGKIADNFHHMGIAAYLDPIGIVCTTGVDKNNHRYIVHPDSRKVIVGFRIPIWDKVCATVKEAAQVVPDVRYIGWDVVITEDYNVALVEGNPGADPDAEQITTKEGRWPLYNKYLLEIKNSLMV